MEENILQVQNLTKTFSLEAGFFSKNKKNVYALNDVTFSVPFGKTYGILGESGCGKTTTARILIQLYKQTSGKILINKKVFDSELKTDEFLNLSDFSKKDFKIYQEKVKYVFQDPAKSLNPKMNILQILTSPLKYSSQWKDKIDALEKAQKIIQEVGFSKEDLYRRPSEFSGGQRQRISIARELILNPSLLICDEVVSALDVSIQGQIINMLKDLQDARNLSCIFITHDLRVACYFCDKIGVMYRGVLVEEDSAKDFYKTAFHPYTKLLFEGANNIFSDSNLEVKTTLQAENCCPFAHRCKFATEKCKNQLPELKTISDNHKVRCFL